MSEKVKLPSIIDGKSFKFIRTEKTKSGHKIVVECLLCGDGKELSGSTTTTGNFYTHLKRAHHEKYEAVRKSSNAISPSEPNLSHLVTGVTKGSKKESDRLILDYIVNSMKPLSTVSDPYFIKMIKGHSSDRDLQIMTRNTLENELKAQYDCIILEIKNELTEVDYVCLTADCWSSHARAFFGVTCHWINNDYKRESRTLSCLRFKGIHSYDRIAEKLQDIMNKYEISLQKVVSIVTDNGSNFCKAFREFAVTLDEEEDSLVEGLCSDERVEVCPVLDPDGNSINEFREDPDDVHKPVYREQICDVLSRSNGQAKDEVTKFRLPPHVRCASHTLSLVATTDLNKVKGRNFYNKVMGKCTKLWNLSTSPKSAEIIIKACGKTLVRPVPTRWNSLYKAVERILEVKHGLDQVCKNLGVPTFSEKDLQFLQEYATISAPVAVALDMLQGEEGIFMGIVLPVLLRSRKKLIKLRSEIKHCGPFLEAYIDGINKRFGHILDYDVSSPSDFVIGSMSHPNIKLRWAPLSDHAQLKKAFVYEARKFYKPLELKKQAPAETKTRINYALFESSDDDDEVEHDNKLNGVLDLVELECLKYFNNPTLDVRVLDKFPTIQRMFRKFNTSLPSSAPVERLFSYGGLIFSSRRSNLSDSRFEQLILLKCNNLFKN